MPVKICCPVIYKYDDQTNDTQQQRLENINMRRIMNLLPLLLLAFGGEGGGGLFYYRKAK